MSKCKDISELLDLPDLSPGPDAHEPITYMAMDGKAVWAAAGSDVIKYLRGKEVTRVSNPFGSTLSFILIFGTQLLALTEDGKHMIVWDTNEGGKPIAGSHHIYELTVS